MRGIPTSRPAAQGERESLTPEEFARRAGGDEASRDRAVNQETFLRNEFGVRTFGYTSFVVDPPNGQMPALTPAGIARRKGDRDVGHVRQRSVQRLRRLHALRPLHHARRGRHRSAGALRQRPPHRADAERSRHQLRDDARHARHPARRPAARRLRHHSSTWATRAATGKATRWSSRRRTSPTGPAVNGAPHSERLKLTERFTRIDPQMIDYRVRVDDPDTYTAPFTHAADDHGAARL